MSKHLPIEKYVPAVRLQGGIYTNLPVTLNGTVANLSVGGTLTVTGATVQNGAFAVTSASANALAVGANGTTNPVLKVDASTASVATGISITGAAAASGVVISAISSGTNEDMTLTPKGSGTLNLNTTHGFSVFGGNVGISSTSANALAVGPANVTNPTLNVDSSASGAVTGINVAAAAAGSGVAVSVTSSGTDENLTVAAKGAGTVTLNPAVVAAAGGKASSGLKYGSIGVGLFTGTGAPSFSAMNGSIYTDSNATTTTTRIYVNKSGAGTAGTTWTNLTTAA